MPTKLRTAIRVLLVGILGAVTPPQMESVSGAGLPQRDTVNAGTVTVITAPVGGPMSVMGSDMANVLDDGENLRVLPMLGKGAVQNLIDIVLLRNVDMGFVTSDALEFVKTEYDVPDIAARVRYIALLFHNDVHIVARQEIRTLQDLEGKQVFAEQNIGLPAARIIFRRLGIKANIDSHTDADGGLQKLLNGEGDAWIASVGKGAPVIKSIRNQGERFHLLSIPYERSLQDVYLPSSFSSAEYPNLVPAGGEINTVTAPTMLMVYNWPQDSERYRRTARFVDALFANIDKLQQPPRHPKWRDTVISASVAGLQRFKPAQDWLDRANGSAAPRPLSVRTNETREPPLPSNNHVNTATVRNSKSFDPLRRRDAR